MTALLLAWLGCAPAVLDFHVDVEGPGLVITADAPMEGVRVRTGSGSVAAEFHAPVPQQTLWVSLPWAPGERFSVEAWTAGQESRPVHVCLATYGSAATGPRCVPGLAAACPLAHMVPRLLGRTLAWRVVRVATRSVVRRVDDLRDRRHLVLDQDLDALLQRHVRHATALTPATQTDVRLVLIDLEQLDPAAM